MKQNFILFILISILGLSTVRTEANPVDKSTVASIAAKVLNKAVVDATPQHFTECYLFVGADGKGFVLIAADDCVRPVLGYSPNGTFDTDNMPDHIAAWIDGYRLEIASVIEARRNPAPKVMEEWQRWSNGLSSSKEGSVAPLLTSVWNQSNPYNIYCPYNNTYAERTVTGCVATAMAQIMRYWHWPDVGYGIHIYEWPPYGTLGADFGSTYYNWDMMPDTLKTTCSSLEKDAVATLMYHAGVSVNMMYGPPSAGGSAAYSYSAGSFDFACAENAYKTYFRYNPLLVSRYKDAYSEAEWEALMHAELDAGRPVHYGAVQPRGGGHAFVIDGYDNMGMYHVNWGWGGNCDGWYTIDSLAPAEGGAPYYCFNGIAEAIMGIYPHTQPATSAVTINIVSNDPSLGTVTGSGVYQPYDTVNVLVQAAEGCRYVGMASGLRNVPFSFLAVGNDYTDTAIFERITGDPIGYCYDNYIEDQPWSESGTFEWGIRIPASMRQGRPLSAVQLNFLSEGYHTLNIYQNETTLNGAIPVYTKTYQLTGAQGWRTLALDSVLQFGPDQSIWITLSFTSNSVGAAPIAASSYCGNPDGSWYHFPEGWDIYHPIGGYYTWQIRAVMENNVGIAEMQNDNLTYRLQGLSLTVENPDGATVRIYDMLGRQLATSRLSSFNFQLPNSGIYLLQADGHSARRIIAVK